MKRRYNYLKEKVTDFIDDDDHNVELKVPNDFPEEDFRQRAPEEAYQAYIDACCDGHEERWDARDFYDRYEGYYESPKEFIEEYIDRIDTQEFLAYYSGWFIDLYELGIEILYLYEGVYDLEDRELHGASEFIGNLSKEKNLSEEEIIKSRVLGEIEALISEGQIYYYERIAKAYLDALVSVKNHMYGRALLHYIEETFGDEYISWDYAEGNFFDGLNGDFTFCDGYVFRID